MTDTTADVGRKLRTSEKTSHRQRELVIDGVVADSWAEPRLFDAPEGKERNTLAARAAADDRHKVTGAKLAHTGQTCGSCAHFQLRDKEGKFWTPGDEWAPGMKRVGTKVCTSMLERGQQCPDGEPACVQWKARA